ncbi:hypothetical protein SAMN05216232_0186 [Virgibacillus subterraneus]|uniref:Uncharacterized protein n=1 Tax=Virgibacillus subterraneus TaxID=621109 RepID=A0A1H8YY13_9BACI|nr:hypothetical protein [Virgibacillus subterraneus]SEP56937.1 hypothetical protein SAMN05216232_0186 [Virgibacillus subterraneus]
MAKIKSPNPKYNGVSASLPFANGEAETDDKWLIDWFKQKGYEVDDSAEKKAAEEAAQKEAEQREIEEAEAKAQQEAEDKAKAEEEAAKEKNRVKKENKKASSK